MATANRRHGKWFANFVDHTGKRRRPLLKGVTTRRDAEKLANAMEAKATRITAGLDTALDNTAAVEPLVEAFLLYKLSSSSYENARHYASALAATAGKFTTADGRSWPPRKHAPFDVVRDKARTFHPGALSVGTVAEITPDRWEQYVTSHRHALKTRTLNARLTALKSLLKWACKGGKTASNPLADVGSAGKPAKNIRFLTTAQGNKLVASSPEPEQTWWLFLLSTGLRRSEFIGLRWPSVYLKAVGPFKHGFVRVEAETSKGKRHRDIPLTATLQPRLRELHERARDPEGVAFVNGGDRPLVNNLPRKLRKALKRAGLKPNAVSLHGLRHSFATGLLLNGANIVSVSKLLGHVNVTQTLDTYAHCLPQDLQAAMGHLPFDVPENGAVAALGAVDDSQLTA